MLYRNLGYHHREAPPPPPHHPHPGMASSFSKQAPAGPAAAHLMYLQQQQLQLQQLQHGSRPRPPPNRPFDPDDLSRRLMVVLADQQASEKKKRARVFASLGNIGGGGGGGGGGHHHPREPASAGDDPASRHAEIRARWGLGSGGGGGGGGGSAMHYPNAGGASSGVAAAAATLAGQDHGSRSSSRALRTRSVENFRAPSALNSTGQDVKKGSTFMHRNKENHNVLTKKYSSPELARRSRSQQSMRDRDATTNTHVPSHEIATTHAPVVGPPLIDRIDARQAAWRRGMNSKTRLQDLDEEKPIETVPPAAAVAQAPAPKSQQPKRYRSVRKSESCRDQLYERGCCSSSTAPSQGSAAAPYPKQNAAEGNGKRRSRNTVDGATQKLSWGHGRKSMRRSSTGELYRPCDTPVEENEDPSSSSPSYVAQGRSQTAEGYYFGDISTTQNPVDWTQSDEKKKTRKPLLKKADSLLGLKTKFGSFSNNKHARDADRPLAEQWRDTEDSSNFPSDDSPLSPKSPKSPRSRFFWPFKR